MANLTKQSAFASPLLTLPHELRFQIYRYAFTPNEDEHPNMWGSLPSNMLRPLRTCRQIYQEAKFLAISCVSWPVDCGGDLDFAGYYPNLNPDMLSAIKSVTFCYHMDHTSRGEHNWLFYLPDYPFDKFGLHNIEELVLWPTGQDETWKKLKPREDAVGGPDSPVEITLAAFARALMATIRRRKALKKIVVDCRQFILRKNLPKLRKEFRSEFAAPSFQNWSCEQLEVAFQGDYYNWAQRWYIIVVEPDRWRLVYEGLDDEERSVTLEFRVSDEWEAYYAKYAVDSPPLRERQLAFFERVLSPGLLETLRNLAAAQAENGQGGDEPDENGHDDDDPNENDQGVAFDTMDEEDFDNLSEGESVYTRMPTRAPTPEPE